MAVERNTQLVAAVGQPLAFLLAVPAFVGNPAAGFGGEIQDGGVLGFAGEDAVGGAEVLLQRVRVQQICCFADSGCGLDPVQREGARFLALVAISVQVPVVLVQDNILRRYRPPAGLVVAAGMVMDQ